MMAVFSKDWFIELAGSLNRGNRVRNTTETQILFD